MKPAPTPEENQQMHDVGADLLRSIQAQKAKPTNAGVLIDAALAAKYPPPAEGGEDS